MKLHQTIAEISKFYAPGAVQFYEQIKPNPWQNACDELDRSLVEKTQDEHTICMLFVHKLKNLCEQFGKMNTKPQALSAADAFYLADEQKFKRWTSQREKRCIVCDRKAGPVEFGFREWPITEENNGPVKLHLRKVKESETEVELICDLCDL